MKKLLKLIILFLLLPITVFALDNYKDEVADIVGEEVKENVINVYLFRGDGCPHCAKAEEFLDEEYSDNEQVKVYDYEVWYDKDNAELYNEVQKHFKVEIDAVPFLVVGDTYFVGFSSSTKENIKDKINAYLDDEEDDENTRTLPILGKVNLKEVSLPLVAVILGFIDGFNPCAMWVLIFLITLLLRVKEKSKRWLIGLTFLFTSGLVYFISMLGINLALNIVAVKLVRTLIGIFILVMGILSLAKYIKNRKKDVGCTVVDSEKRQKITKRMINITSNKSLILVILGIIALAASVNIVELACSLGFPVVFSEILALNNVHGLIRIMYLLLYILFYMMDDLIVFIISMVTMEVTGITNKYNKICTLVSAIIMIAIGLLLVFNPSILMFNFK